MEKWHTYLMKLFERTPFVDDYLMALCMIPEGDGKSGTRDYVYAISSSGVLESARQYFMSGAADDIIDDAFVRAEKITELQRVFSSGFFNLQTGICKCGTQMHINDETSELECSFCHRIVSLTGVIFSKTQLHAQNSDNHVKSNTYAPSKHFNFWIACIQGKDDTMVPEELLARIREIFTRDKINCRQINCRLVRQYLNEIHKFTMMGAKKKKEVRASTYSAQAPKIVEQLTGEKPPHLDECTHRRLLHKFSTIIEIYDKEIRIQLNKTNRPHYPYFIYKLIEQDDKIERSLKRSLLDNIAMQRPGTIQNNDKIFKSICKIMDKKFPDIGVIYKPT